MYSAAAYLLRTRLNNQIREWISVGSLYVLAANIAIIIAVVTSGI
jgi:Ni/Co efflux regulator RcnB